MNLKDILHTLYLIESSLSENNGELTDELDGAFELTNEALADKVDSYAFVMDRCNSMEEEYLAKAAVLGRIAKGYARLRDSLETRLKLASKQLGDELIGNDWRFKVSTTEGKLIVDLPAEKLPPEYVTMETVFSVNTKALKNDLKLGLEVNGARIEKGQSIRRYPNRKEVTNGNSKITKRDNG